MLPWHSEVTRTCHLPWWRSWAALPRASDSPGHSSCQSEKMLCVYNSQSCPRLSLCHSCHTVLETWKHTTVVIMTQCNVVRGMMETFLLLYRPHKSTKDSTAINKHHPKISPYYVLWWVVDIYWEFSHLEALYVNNYDSTAYLNFGSQILCSQ